MSKPKRPDHRCEYMWVVFTPEGTAHFAQAAWLGKESVQRNFVRYHASPANRAAHGDTWESHERDGYWCELVRAKKCRKQTY